MDQRVLYGLPGAQGDLAPDPTLQLFIIKVKVATLGKGQLWRKKKSAHAGESGEATKQGVTS